jgi:hypothetical protein
LAALKFFTAPVRLRPLYPSMTGRRSAADLLLEHHSNLDQQRNWAITLSVVPGTPMSSLA